MAMIKPIGQQVSAFDAIENHLFYFTSVGGNQVVKNKLTIRRNDTNEIVYQKTIESYSFEHLVPKNTLINGTYYNYYINTYDINNNESESSMSVQFYCYTKPSIVVINMPSNNIVVSSNYQFDVTYSQKEGELIDAINYSLYDNFNNLLLKSENLYSSKTPPINFSYKISELMNNSNYKLEVSGATVNGTRFTTGKLDFVVRYENPHLFSILGLESKCNDGYVQISSRLVTIDGFSNPYPPEYIDDKSINLLENEKYVKWTQGFNIENKFTCSIWFKTSFLGKILELKKDDNNKFELNFVRGVLENESMEKDYVEVIGYENSEPKFYMHSNYIPITNNMSDLMVWFRYDSKNSKYELKLVTINEHIDNILNWNDSVKNNVSYNRLSNILLGSKTDIQKTTKENNFIDMSSVFPITEVRLLNGIYDNINITSNTESAFTTEKPEWLFGTILRCDFNNTINGGNTNIILSQIEKIKIKRREFGSFDWITLYEVPIKTEEDLNIIKSDFIVPSGIKQEYALVPILYGDIDGEYIVNTITPKWNYVFVSDKDSSFKLFSNVLYGATTSVLDIGWHTPIGSKYPVSIENGELDYEQGSIGGTIIGDSYSTTNIINRNEVTKLFHDWFVFLKNGKTKVIKDWNGNIKIARTSASPSNSFFQSYGNGFGTINFFWYEQGKYNNKLDLFLNKLTDIYE